MAVITSHQLELKLDNGIGGSLTAYHAQATKVSLDVEPQSARHHVFGTRGSYTTIGGIVNSFTLTARAETTATSLYGILMAILQSATFATYNGTLSYQIGIPDIASTGSHLYSGECKVTKASKAASGEAGKGEVQLTDFSFDVDGAQTYAVV